MRETEPEERGRSQPTLERIRTDRRVHLGTLAVAVAVGVVLAWLHWLGLVVGGALVGVVSPTLRYAVAAAGGFGLVVFGVFALTLGGSVGPALAMRPIIYVTAASAVGLPVFGALLRGLR